MHVSGQSYQVFTRTHSNGQVPSHESGEPDGHKETLPAHVTTQSHLRKSKPNNAPHGTIDLPQATRQLFGAVLARGARRPWVGPDRSHGFTLGALPYRVTRD